MVQCVEAESEGTRFNLAREELRAASQTLAAAPKPELMFSFGLCKVVQGTKEAKGRRSKLGGGWLQVNSSSSWPGLLHELQLRGQLFLGLISTSRSQFIRRTFGGKALLSSRVQFSSALHLMLSLS